MVISDLGNRTDSQLGELFAGFQAMIHHGEGLQPTGLRQLLPAPLLFAFLKRNVEKVSVA